MNNILGEKRMKSKKFIVTLMLTLAVLSLFSISVKVFSDIAYYPDHTPPYYVWTPWLYSWARQYGSDCHVAGYEDGWSNKQTITYGSAGVSAGYPSSPYWTPDDPLRDYDFKPYDPNNPGPTGSCYYLYVYERIYLSSQQVHLVFIKIRLYPDGSYFVDRSDSSS
jgi:hypothetical protein